MKPMIVLLLLLMTSTHAITKADEITYDFLIETSIETGNCDHVFIFDKIFQTIQVKNMLEFGLGYSTKYFLDHCTKVISVEFISPAWPPTWMKQCLDLYREYSNWVPICYFTGYKGDYAWATYKFFGGEALFKADSHFAKTGTSYKSIDPAYINELSTFISNLCKYQKFQVALVDQGNLLRGEVVELLFGKIPVIVTTDVATSQIGYNPYGFNNIQTPDNYTKLYIPFGKGILVWIENKEELADLIQVLEEYAN